MDAKLKTEWLQALRSGKYKQARYVLKDGRGRYCCLGVLADLHGVDWIEMKHNLWTLNVGQSVATEYGLDWNTGGVLSEMNDTGKSFAEIADYIEAHVQAR